MLTCRRLAIGLCLASLSPGGLAQSLPALETRELPPLPMPVTNNAVTGVTVGDREFLVSFLGLGAGKGHGDTLDATFVLEAGTGGWSRAAPVPGGVGRLAGSAASANGIAFVFGGYTVAEDGAEESTPWVHAFDPLTATFEERQPMPVPVDDAVAVAYEDRYIYLVSGWHDHGNVNLVQRYDTATDSWRQATPIPGRAVFGHAGGIVGNRIVYCDGVAIGANPDRGRDFVASDECFVGIIDASDGRRIDWRKAPPHPRLPRYRMAAAGVEGSGTVLFVGGSENPYNYDGIGYDGRPSLPAAGALSFDLMDFTWAETAAGGDPGMDYRGLVPFGGGWVAVGGMRAGQVVSDRVVLYTVRD
jgi:hypothetical protein